jgi:hypothetical protein
MGMLAKYSFAVTLIGVSFASIQANGQSLHDQIHIGYLRNNAWPVPFRGMDATAVTLPFEAQKSNGWRQFNTIGSAFFDADHALTDAGKQKVAVTLTKTPTNRRAIFVMKGNSPLETNARVEAVQIAVSEMVPVGALPEIFVTDRDNMSVSGEAQTILNRGMTRMMPAPVLPKFNGLNKPSNQQQMPVSNQR